MAVSHVKSNTIGGWTGTVTVAGSNGSSSTVAASDLVLPADWNSAHNQFYSVGGNTTGASTASGTNVQWYGSGNIYLKGSGASMVVSHNPSYQIVGNTLGSTTASGTNVVWGASGGISLKGTSDSMVISGPVASYLDIHGTGVVTTSGAFPVATSGIVSLYPFNIPGPLSAGVMDMLASASFVTVGNTTGSQTMGFYAGIYARAASNTQLLTCLTSTNAQWSVSGNNSSYSVVGPSSTAYTGYGQGSTSSSGVNFSASFTGYKKIGFPVNTYLSPGGYWLGLNATQSTAGNASVGWSMFLFGPRFGPAGLSNLGPMGNANANYSTGSGPEGGPWHNGMGVWTSAGSVTGLPVSINFASITISNIEPVPMIRFWST